MTDELANLTDDELFDRYSQALWTWSGTTAGSSSRVKTFVRFVLMEKCLCHRLERTRVTQADSAAEPRLQAPALDVPKDHECGQ
jgi:hypothetical protein